MTLTEFILARIAEDEADAERAARFPYLLPTDAPWSLPAKPGSYGRHQVRWSPDRVLAECAAKRRIVEDHAPMDRAHPRRTYVDENDEDGTEVRGEPACRQCTRSAQQWRVTSNWDARDRVVAPCDTMRALAAVYADHPDYRQEWAS